MQRRPLKPLGTRGGGVGKKGSVGLRAGGLEVGRPPKCRTPRSPRTAFEPVFPCCCEGISLNSLLVGFIT